MVVNFLQMTLQGKYYVDRLEMRAGNIVFVMNGASESEQDLGIREMLDSDEGDTRPYVYCYAAPDGLQAKVVPPHFINLGDMRTMEVELDSGRNDIKNGVIRVRPATAGLRLRVAEAKMVEGKVEANVKNDAGNIEFTDLAPKSFVRFRIPYTTEENHGFVFARLEVIYKTDKGQFSYSTVCSVTSALPISVNVQDIFKNDALFSRFTVGPAMLAPLRILNCNIPSSDVYEVQSSISDSGIMDVFAKQPASLLYKIKQRTEGAPRASAKSSLHLTVEFTCVDDESLDAVERKFRSDIEASKFREYTTLLSSHVVDTIRARLTPYEAEVIGLVRETEIPSYQSLQWEGLLGALKEPRDEIKNWLVEWHKVSLKKKIYIYIYI